MFLTIFIIFLLVISTEAVTEIVSKSELFSPLRAFLFEKGKNNKVFNFMHHLIDCGYCTSVWMATFIVFGFLLFPKVFFIFCIILSVHRLANTCHSVIGRLDNFDELEMKR